MGSEGLGNRSRERRAVVLGSVTVPGRPEQVSNARAFITRALSRQPRIDSDAATLLTSELVTNAIQHTKSGEPGGTVTVVAIGIPGGVLVEVVDEGSPGTPIVKGDLYAAEGHGLYLVQQLAAQWGYLRDAAGTTVWFHLPAIVPAAGSASPESPVAEGVAAVEDVTAEAAVTGVAATARESVANPGAMLAGLALALRFLHRSLAPARLAPGAVSPGVAGQGAAAADAVTPDRHPSPAPSHSSHMRLCRCAMYEFCMYVSRKTTRIMVRSHT